MNTVTATVRLPKKLKQEADKLVKKGYFKNLSDAMIAGLRHETEIHRTEDTVREIKEIRKKMWDEYLKKANGDPEKASKIMFREIKKEEAKEPWFYKDSVE